MSRVWTDHVFLVHINAELFRGKNVYRDLAQPQVRPKLLS